MVKTNKKHLLREVSLTNSTGPESLSRQRRNYPTIYLRISLLLLTILLCAGAASAQLNIPVIRGDNGLKAGSQGPPGTYVGALYYYYESNEVIDRNGTRIRRAGVNMSFPALILSVVTKKKILGANYSATLVVDALNTAIDSPFTNNVTGLGISDTYVQPIQLGWNKKRYDARAGYAFYAPTGKFTAGGSNNHGLGMWSHEFTAGATVYLDEKKQWNASTIASYNIQSHIRGTNRKAGNVLSLEGGFGHTFCSGLCNLGIDYYTQWKVTTDKLPPVPSAFIANHRYYGVGPEVNGVIPISAKKMAIFRVAFFHEFGNRVAPQGNSIIMSFAFAKLKG